MFKKILGFAGKKAFEYIKPKVNIPQTKIQKQLRDLKIGNQKLKGTKAKLDQTLFEIKNPKFKGKDFTFKSDKGKSESKKESYNRIVKENTKVLKGVIDDAFKEKKAKGGRVGLRLGTKKKSNVDKIKKTFGPKSLGMQSVIYGLDKNPKITKADPKAKFIAAANKKKKKVI